MSTEDNDDKQLGIHIPNFGMLTPREIHSAVLGSVGFLLGATRAWKQVKNEPWYAVFSFIVSLIAGILFRRRLE